MHASGDELKDLHQSAEYMILISELLRNDTMMIETTARRFTLTLQPWNHPNKRDPQSGPTAVMATIQVKNSGRIKWMTFAQHSTVNGVQSHIQVKMEMNSYSHTFSEAVWNLPSACYASLNYDATFYRFFFES